MPCDTKMCQQTGLSVVHVMVWRPNVAKPSPKPMLIYCQLDAHRPTWANYETNKKRLNKMQFKCHSTMNRFAQVSLCWGILSQNSIEAKNLIVWLCIIILFWKNSPAVLSTRLSNFKAMQKFKLPITRLRDFTRSYNKGPGTFWYHV